MQLRMHACVCLWMHAVDQGSADRFYLVQGASKDGRLPAPGGNVWEAAYTGIYTMIGEGDIGDRFGDRLTLSVRQLMVPVVVGQLVGQGLRHLELGGLAHDDQSLGRRVEAHRLGTGKSRASALHGQAVLSSHRLQPAV